MAHDVITSAGGGTGYNKKGSGLEQEQNKRLSNRKKKMAPQRFVACEVIFSEGNEAKLDPETVFHSPVTESTSFQGQTLQFFVQNWAKSLI